jgi:hypothetical protein
MASAAQIEWLQRIQVAARDAKDAPKPDAIDEFAVEFDRLDRELAKAKKSAKDAAMPVAALEPELIALVRSFGGPHAEKSKILHGIAWEMMATFGQGMLQDAAAIERLRLALKKAKQARLLKKLFQQDIRWTFKASSVEVVKREKLTPKLLRLLLLCFVPVDKTPTLDVREKKKAARSR